LTNIIAEIKLKLQKAPLIKKEAKRVKKETKPYVILVIIFSVIGAVGGVLGFWMHSLKSTECEIHISVFGQGTTKPSQGTWSYKPGDIVNITAFPDLDEGYTFECWNVDGVEFTDNPLILTIERSMKIIAVFERDNWELNIIVSGRGETLPEEGEYYFPKEDNKTVTISALTTEEDWEFSYWEIGNETITQNPIIIIMDADKAVIAYFFEVS
jgi:hypothetical protein